MKTLYYSMFSVILVCSCHNSNVPTNILDHARKKFKKDADAFNSFYLRQDRFEDSLYKIAASNLDSGIKAIDKFILESPTSSHYHKIKGDFYFRYNEWQNAKINYTKAIQLEPYSNAAVYRASCYLNLKQYDRCLRDLNSFPEYNKSNYWYIGNFYEARLNKDSAIHYYEMLYQIDSTVYKYCIDRIDYLKKEPNPKMFKGLILRDTGRATIRLSGIQ